MRPRDRVFRVRVERRGRRRARLSRILALARIDDGHRVVTRPSARAPRGSIATAAARGTDDRARDVDPSASASASSPRRSRSARARAHRRVPPRGVRRRRARHFATATIDDASVAVPDAPPPPPPPSIPTPRSATFASCACGRDQRLRRVPEGWVRDQPMANTPEFHPRSERRSTISRHRHPHGWSPRRRQPTRVPRRIRPRGGGRGWVPDPRRRSRRRKRPSSRR